MKSEPFQRMKFWQAAGWFSAWFESWLVSLLLVVGLLSLASQMDLVAVNSGMFFIGPLYATWGALRWRIPAGSRQRQLAQEALVAAAFAVLIPAALGLSLWFLSLWPALDLYAPGAGGAGFLVAIAFSSLVFPLLRLIIRLWIAWARLQRKKMAYSMAHAMLVFAMLVAVLAIFGFILLNLDGRAVGISEPVGANPVAALASQLTGLILPVLVTSGAGAVAVLVLLAPLAGLLAYTSARRTTQRLEELAGAATRLRNGDLQARVAVSGEDEVSQLQENFNHMAAALERSLQDLQNERDRVAGLLASRRELFANISHELRTPLATLAACLDSDLSNWSEAPPPVLHHDLEVMRGEIGRLKGLVDDVFLLARTDLDRLKVDCRPVNVLPVVQRAVEAFSPLAWQSSRVQVFHELRPEVPSVHVDEDRLAQILGNLLRNAIRHTRPGGLVAVSVTCEPGVVKIEVRDTGEGIAPEELERIWEPFYQGEKSRLSDQDSSGIGLALVRQLTEAMGGRVSVESEPGKGSCFNLHFPTV